MAKRLILIILLLALAGGVVSGTPLHSPNDKMMKCCDRAKSKDKSPEASIARLCCGLNCSESTPTPSSVSFNFSPSNVTISKSIADQIAALFPEENVQESTSFQYSRKTLSRTFQPKYIQHNSLLI